jgi:dCMP deaminase
MEETIEFNRPNWDQYFINIAKLTSERSNCIKRRVGCVIVKDKRILSLGYNGTPVNTLNCYQGGCKRCMDQYKRLDTVTAKHLDLCMCLHAEENAILFVSKIDLKDSTIYITLIPCISCVKKILQCQIKRVVYINNYSEELDEITIDILKLNNIEIIKWNEF